MFYQSVMATLKHFSFVVVYSRAVEFLTNNGFALSVEMRVPAHSRLQKIHNVGVALRSLTNDHGMDLNVQSRGGAKSVIDPRDIADGHREKTLQLLWSLIFKFQVRRVSLSDPC